MKDEIKKICEQLNYDEIGVLKGTEQLLDLFAVSGQSELLLDFVRWQNRCSKWVTIPESMVEDYLAYKKSSNSH
jgi:hypothetical protein